MRPLDLSNGLLKLKEKSCDEQTRNFDNRVLYLVFVVLSSKKEIKQASVRKELHKKKIIEKIS